MGNQDTGLWEAITSYDSLLAAWVKVDANDGSSGGDGVSRKEFRDDRFARINQIRAEVLTGEYKSRPFRRVSIPKKKPGYRILTIPAIRDRVLHTSIAKALTPIFEPLFEDSSFAYRPGRGTKQAVARIEHWRDRGYQTVIEADIVRYFDNINHEFLIEKIDEALRGQSDNFLVNQLIRRLLKDQAKALKTKGMGLVQGSPLSPLLSNLYLDALDEEIEDQGVKLVRFADDFVILCKTHRKAERVLTHCTNVLGQHGLRLHADGTRIVNFDKGFDFIGNLFLRSLALKTKKAANPKKGKPIKSEVTDEGVIQLDDMGSKFDQGNRVLYVLNPLFDLKVRNRSFSVVREDDAEMITISNRRIGRIEVGPKVQFDRSVIDLVAETNLELAVIDNFGQTKCTVLGRPRRKASVHLSQASMILKPDLRLIIAKKIVLTRIQNQRTQLFRLNRKPVSGAVNEILAVMKSYLDKASGSKTVKAAMGYEGKATASYWLALSSLCKATKDRDFKRTRPATEPLNAAVNYLTGILERDIRAAIHSTGLHQGFAFLHGTRDRHDGLVYDLMEPFRAPLTEGLPVYLFNARRLRLEMFTQPENDATIINADGKRAIIEGYEAFVKKTDK